VTPKSLLLDLLRVAPEPVAVRRLVGVGDLFGFEANAVRVALTRLVAAGLVESDERGSYRLGAASSPVAALVDAWRLGDARLRAWKGGWLCVHHPRGGQRGARHKSLGALARLGFREGLEALWIRPDNLRRNREELVAELSALRLARGATPFLASDFSEALVGRWRTTLWPLAQLRAGWRRTLGRLETGSARLSRMSLEQALVESFVTGGEAIRVLALDPLLPDEILDGSERRRLHQAMVRYDERGRAIWNEFLGRAGLDSAPSHLGIAS
jgi:phenylacetic acid degradation operon negative regulatory protein